MPESWKSYGTSSDDDTNVVAVFETVSRGLEKRLGLFDIRGGIEDIQTTVLLRSAWLLIRNIETLGD